MRFLFWLSRSFIILVEEGWRKGCVFGDLPIGAVLEVIQVVEVRSESHLGGFRGDRFLAEIFRRTIAPLELCVDGTAILIVDGTLIQHLARVRIERGERRTSIEVAPLISRLEVK